LVNVKPMEEILANTVEDSYRRAYLGGKKSLKWIVGMIRSSGLRNETLLEVLDRVNQYALTEEGKKERAEELRKELRLLKFI